MYCVCMLQVAITTPSRSTPFHKTLGEEEGRVARALAGGHASSIASAVMKIPDVKKELHIHFLNSIIRNFAKRIHCFVAFQQIRLLVLDRRSS